MARRASPISAVPDEAEWLRPADAAGLFGVSERTLARWAAERWIGRSEIGRIVLYRRQDIAALIAAHSTPRQVVTVAPATPAAPDRSWEESDFCQDGESPSTWEENSIIAAK